MKSLTGWTSLTGVVGLAMFLFTPGALGADPLDLEQCYQASLKRSEIVANQEELIVQAEENLSQAQGAIMPTVNGVYTFLTQGTPSAGTASSISPATQNTARVTATQPLFRGFREFAALRQRKDTLIATKLQMKQAEIQLFQDVAQNFYQVLSNEKDIFNTENEIILNEKRLKELEHFRQIGRSRPSEVLTLQSNIATLEATLEGFRGQLKNSRAVFTFLTGLDQNTPLRDLEKGPEGTETLDRYLQRVDTRPDVQSLLKSMAAAEEGVGIARGGHLPSVDLLGNYYFVRPGVLSNVTWDVGLGVTIPIFQGGIVNSQVRQAASVVRQSELALTRGRRSAQQEIESNFSLFQSDLNQVEKQKRALDLALKTYDTEVRDYKLGLVTNIEVLTALTTYQQNQRLLNRSEYQLKLDYLKLQASAAFKPEKITGNSPESDTK